MNFATNHNQINRYIVCPRFGPPRQIESLDCRLYDDADLDYFINCFQLLENRYQIRDLTIVFAYDTTTELPCFGNNVVVVIYGDERCRIPTYAGKVRAIFKCYGSRPYFNCTANVSVTNLFAALEFIRNGLLFLPRWHHCLRTSGTGSEAITIPLGYGKQRELPLKPFSERRYLLSFQGSIVRARRADRLVKKLIGTPKTHARRSMLREVSKLKQTLGEDKIFIRITESFQASREDQGIMYSETMNDTKICLAPRGTSAETFRFFEGMRYGCLVICDRLPPHWFYVGSPAIQVNHWSELPDILFYFKANPQALQTAHERSLQWWREKCCEHVLAEFIADHLQLEPAAR